MIARQLSIDYECNLPIISFGTLEKQSDSPNVQTLDVLKRSNCEHIAALL
jgi:hypothetical protein